MKTTVLYAVLALAGGLQNSLPPSIDPRILNFLHPPPKPSDPPAAMTLPPGYKHASSVDFEGNTSGEISKADGLFIRYDYLFYLYSTVFPVDKNQYREYVEETINEHLLWRGFRSGRYEVNVDMCRTPEFAYVVNFSAAIKESTQAVDMVAVARTLANLGAPHKGLDCDVLLFPTPLPGYDHNLSVDDLAVDEYVYVGKMTRTGLSIDYKMPCCAYSKRVPMDKSQYREYAEETIEGHRLWRGFQADRYEVKVDLCRVSAERSHIVRFTTEVKESAQAADMVAIARSLVGPARSRDNGCVSMD